MEEAAVREHAQVHGDATVAGDFKTAGGALTEEARAQAPGIMKAMPGKLTRAEISSVQLDGAEAVVNINYVGEEGATLVESRWVEREGRPMISNLSLV